MRPFQIYLTLLLTLGAATLAVSGETTEKAPPPVPYVAHEWGTFTSVQGSDGVALDWRPLVRSDLPKFVYDRSKKGVELQQAAYLNKFSTSVRQRMETPVIYFYAEAEITVSALVLFPQGLITEWYPRLNDFRPRLGMNNKAPEIKNGMAFWNNVRLLPKKSVPANVTLPREPESSHYYPARETDSDYVRVSTRGANNVLQEEYEKFLFYRGVGNFDAPLRVTPSSSTLSAENISGNPLSNVVLLRVEDGRAAFRVLGHVSPKSKLEASLELGSLRPLNEVLPELSQNLTDALTAAKLYPKEAAAMVATWKDAWFEENGTRLLYLIPQEWTDQVLPLTLNPAPKEVVRVMVGRAELLTPQMESAVRDEITKLDAESFDAREEATRVLRKYDRFAEPMLVRAKATSTSPEIQKRADIVLKSLREPATR